jgi:hypothetical protein
MKVEKHCLTLYVHKTAYTLSKLARTPSSNLTNAQKSFLHACFCFREVFSPYELTLNFSINRSISCKTEKIFLL